MKRDVRGEELMIFFDSSNKASSWLLPLLRVAVTLAADCHGREARRSMDDVTWRSCSLQLGRVPT